MIVVCGRAVDDIRIIDFRLKVDILVFFVARTKHWTKAA